IGKGESKPNLGDKVLNEDRRPIGTIFDVFGPVSSPYISVKTCVDKPSTLINKILYTTRPRRRRRK
ncbi:MAG: hypothetical protein QXL67_03635, partial [Candidatus Bathyarchaeia archaeon]